MPTTYRITRNGEVFQSGLRTLDDAREARDIECRKTSGRTGDTWIIESVQTVRCLSLIEFALWDEATRTSPTENT